MFNVVLYQPEIPHNTGAVGRLCLATGAVLHLVKPLGFSIDDKQLKRAGLDYWKEVKVVVWESFEELRAVAEREGAKMFFLTTKTTRGFWDAEFADGSYLVFGPESRGLPEGMLKEFEEGCLRIPMEGTRSLNLATSVGIVLYEGQRQIRKG
ncbi:tRNA (cytidine(34)-2'-O)-methyltransferase [Phragmitibacter flavus]|uniref:Putative tRNA (cytidine(34)-2'-O)-methyltransferase n=1 Tax=Phragmitibacter flavus TaxID=2576071 RepID=A0A5R8KBU4_9BACT|nr:tRNA (cytidine(34)-2'-O)-methyltransferase [Phragmitibacter flavus]TLD69766.1 tRNA (cytidine(34)-2'-O)-methyltransferase [Phragmitibacter flavus]